MDNIPIQDRFHHHRGSLEWDSYPQTAPHDNTPKYENTRQKTPLDNFMMGRAGFTPGPGIIYTIIHSHKIVSLYK